MNVPQDEVRAYLRRVREISSRATDAAVAALDRDRAGFERVVEAEPERARAALAHLARKRLLASNTLRSAPRERGAWDAANRWVHDELGRDGARRWSLSELAHLNALVTDGAGVVRRGAVYSCGQEYLAAEHVLGELHALDQHVTASARPASVIAATIYVSVVTIHPFENGNGRTARLAADRVLLAAGYLPLCFLSPVASHVAQMRSGPRRDPERCVLRVLAAVAESYATALGERQRASSDPASSASGSATGTASRWSARRGSGAPPSTVGASGSPSKSSA